MAKSAQEMAAEREGKGDKAATKKAYYRLQREHAEESGDQKTTDKIYGKMGKRSHNVDSSAVDKGILGSVAAGAAIPEVAAARGIGAAAKAARYKAPRLAEMAEEGLSRAGNAIKNLIPRSGKAAKVASKVGSVAKAKAPAASARSAVNNGSAKFREDGSRVPQTKSGTAKFSPSGARKQAPKSTNSGNKQFNSDGSRNKKALNLREGKEEYVHPSKMPKPTATGRGKAEFAKDGARKPKRKN